MNFEDGPEDTQLPVNGLGRSREHRFRIEPDAALRASLAKALGVDAVRKLRFEGQLSATGRTDWRLSAALGASVVQPCVVTLEPVTTRIDEGVERRFVAEPDQQPAGGETEMPEDDTEEALGDVINLWAVMCEALSLALPTFPRSQGAELDDIRVTEPGKVPLSDEDARPFAGLKGLRDQLGDGADKE